MAAIIKFIENSNIGRVLSFFNSAQSDHSQSNSRSAEEFEWLFIKSFFKPSLYAVASESETGDIIGTYAGIFIPMISKNGERIITIKGEDTLLSLDRMIGLGKRDILKELFRAIIEKSSEDNARFMWGFTPAKAPFKRCGFEIITRVKGSFYVVRPIEFYRNRMAKFPEISSTKMIQLFIFAWYNWLNIKLRQLHFTEFSVREIGLEDVDEKLLISFLPANVFSTFLSKDFLNWRIAKNPSALKYRLMEFRDRRDSIVSYLIYSFNKDNIFFIEQFLFERNLTDKRKVDIIKHALSCLRKQKAIMVRAMGLSHNEINRNEMQLLSKAGFYFFENPEESYFVFQNLSGSEVKPEEVYLSRLNTQGTR